MKTVFSSQHGRSQENDSIIYTIDDKPTRKNKIIQIFKMKLLVETHDYILLCA